MAQRNLLTAVAGGAVLLGSSVYANIDLELRSSVPVVEEGDIVKVSLWASSDSKDPQALAAIDAIIAWNPEHLTLLELEPTGFGSVGMPPDPFGINEDDPPADGDAIVVFFAPLSIPLVALPEGTKVTTIRFRADIPIESTSITFLATAGDPTASTRVFDAETAGMDVLGDLRGASIEVIEPVCPADVNDDGHVNFVDLLSLLSAWGECVCVEDISGNDKVDFADLLIMLAAWGPCPT